MDVSCERYVLSGRDFWVGLITRPEESYRVLCVWVWLWNFDSEEALPHQGLLRYEKKNTSPIFHKPFASLNYVEINIMLFSVRGITVSTAVTEVQPLFQGMRTEQLLRGSIKHDWCNHWISGSLKTTKIY
jgi:hypothetical protein